MSLHKELEKIFEYCDDTGGRRMLFTLSDHDYLEIKELFETLDQEFQNLKDTVRAYTAMMNNPETTHDDIEDNLNELIKLLK